MKVFPTTAERFGSALSPAIAIMPKDVSRAKSWLGTVRGKIATAEW